MLPMSFANPLIAQAVRASNPADTSSTSNSSGSSSGASNQLTGDSFLQLLTAQLQAQDPLDPLDPTTFVTQLVQFNQLQQLIDINQTLSQAAGTSGSTNTQSANLQSSASRAFAPGTAILKS